MRLESRRRKDLEERKYKRGKVDMIEDCEGEGRVRKTYHNIWGKTEGC